MKMGTAFLKRWVLFGVCFWAFAQPLSIAGANLALAVILVGVLGNWNFSGNFSTLRDPIEKPLWIYFLMGILASIFAGSLRQSLIPISKDGQIILDFYVFMAAFSLEAGSAILSFWAAGFSLAALLGVGQFALWRFAPARALAFNAMIVNSHFWSPLYAGYRAHAAVHPVTFGEIMGMAALGVLAYRIQKRRKMENAGLLSALFGLAVFSALALSGTRGAWAGFLIGALLLIVLEFRFAVPEVLVAVAVITSQFFFSPRFSKEQSLSGLSLREPSFGAHLALWKAAWRMFLDHPVLGVGSGRFGAFFGKYHAVPFEGQPTWGNAHNLYLHQLAERGILGFAALLLLLGTMMVQAWRGYRQSRSFLSLWFLSWFFALLVMNLTESAFQVGMVWMPTLALYCWMRREKNYNLLSK